MKNSISILFILTSFKFISQSVSYNDVAVIVNDNSQVSIDIGNYFKNARNIPSVNIIHVNAPTTEIITGAQFSQIQIQIENYLIANDLVDSINYLVTTKGVPLKINSGCILDTVPGQSCASFDSEIALVLGDYASSIGLSGGISNPYFNNNSHFTRESLGIYLVTRLDGYSYYDVTSLIDRSGNATGINANSAKAIVDVSNSIAGDSAYFVSLFEPAFNYLVNNSWNALVDYNFSPLTNQNDVFSYLGIGHGPLPFQQLNYNWTDGSFSVMEMCNSSYTFDFATKDPNDLILADLIAKGCTAGYGNVDYIFFGNIMVPEILVNRYLDFSQNYNLAESFYMADKTLSWQTVIIGDPKASLVIDNLANTIEIEENKLTVFPNPSNGDFEINCNTNIQSIHIYDLSGSNVQNIDDINVQNIKLDLRFLKEGVYSIKIVTLKGVLQEKLIKID